LQLCIDVFNKLSVMKKMIIVLLPLMLSCTTNLFSQNKDSLELAKEMERLDRLGDSYTKFNWQEIVLFVNKWKSLYLVLSGI
jgi:hypothetical protein